MSCKSWPQIAYEDKLASIKYWVLRAGVHRNNMRNADGRLTMEVERGRYVDALGALEQQLGRDV